MTKIEALLSITSLAEELQGKGVELLDVRDRSVERTCEGELFVTFTKKFVFDQDTE